MHPFPNIPPDMLSEVIEGVGALIGLALATAVGYLVRAMRALHDRQKDTDSNVTKALKTLSKDSAEVKAQVVNSHKTILRDDLDNITKIAQDASAAAKGTAHRVDRIQPVLTELVKAVDDLRESVHEMRRDSQVERKRTNALFEAVDKLDNTREDKENCTRCN